MANRYYSVKSVACFIKRFGMKAQIIRVGRFARLYGSHPYYSCRCDAIQSNLASYSYVKRVFNAL